MPEAVINRVNQIGKDAPSILTFTNWHGKEIGDTIQDFDLEKDDDKPLTDETTGVELTDETTGVEQINDQPTDMDLDGDPTGVDFDAKPTGVEVEADFVEVHEPAHQEQEKKWTRPTSPHTRDIR